MTKDAAWRALDNAIKRSIVDHNELHDFLLPYFRHDLPMVTRFITKCVKKSKTKRMVLRLHWYGDLATKVDQIEPGRPAIPLIFLLALAEGLEKTAQNKEKDDSNSLGYIHTFFQYIGGGDKNLLHQRFRRLLLKPRYNLSFRSLIKILWNARCNAAHGREY